MGMVSYCRSSVLNRGDYSSPVVASVGMDQMKG